MISPIFLIVAFGGLLFGLASGAFHARRRLRRHIAELLTLHTAYVTALNRRNDTILTVVGALRFQGLANRMPVGDLLAARREIITGEAPAIYSADERVRKCLRAISNMQIASNGRSDDSGSLALALRQADALSASADQALTAYRSMYQETHKWITHPVLKRFTGGLNLPAPPAVAPASQTSA